MGQYYVYLSVAATKIVSNKFTTIGKQIVGFLIDVTGYHSNRITCIKHP